MRHLDDRNQKIVETPFHSKTPSEARTAVSFVVNAMIHDLAHGEDLNGPLRTGSYSWRSSLTMEAGIEVTVK